MPIEDMKRINDSYLYQSVSKDYNKELYTYIMSSDRVDKNDKSFSDVVYEVKHQASSVLLKVLMSNKVVLMLYPKGVSRAFKVIYCKDIKNNNSKDPYKVFIDCSGIIEYTGGEYKCLKSSNLVSYLTTAMAYVLFYNKPTLITSNSVLVKNSTAAFVDLMLYVLSYLKVPVVFADNKEKMSFILAEYFQTSVIGINNGEPVYNVAKSISGIQEKKTCDYYHALMANEYHPTKYNIDQFLAKFAEIFLDQKPGVEGPKNRTKLTTDSFAQRWMYSYGPSTFLGMELFVPFTAMLTDCYVGAFLNQQNTIEKIAGSKAINNFCNELLKVGSENA